MLFNNLDTIHDEDGAKVSPCEGRLRPRKPLGQEAVWKEDRHRPRTAALVLAAENRLKTLLIIAVGFLTVKAWRCECNNV